MDQGTIKGLGTGKLPDTSRGHKLSFHTRIPFDSHPVLESIPEPVKGAEQWDPVSACKFSQPAWELRLVLSSSVRTVGSKARMEEVAWKVLPGEVCTSDLSPRWGHRCGSLSTPWQNKDPPGWLLLLLQWSTRRLTRPYWPCCHLQL